MPGEIQNAYEYHRALIDASPTAIVDFDLSGRVRSWNRAATAIFGWLPEEVIGRVSPIVPEDELPFFLENIRRVAAGETLRDLDLRRLHRDGSLIDVNVAAAPVRDAVGEVVGVVSCMADVTARKRSERMLAASEARNDAILRAVHDAVVVVDDAGSIVEVNPATEETLGWTRADTVGQSFLELVAAPQDRASLSEIFTVGNPLLGSKLEVTALRSDGRSFPAEIAITRVDVPGRLLFAVSLRDVTKQHAREERLRQVEAQYQALVEQIPVATYVNSIGVPLRTTFMSRQIERILGYPASRWLEPDFFMTVLHPDDHERVLAETRRTHDAGEDFRMEYRLIAHDGSTVWILDEAVTVRDAEYRPIMRQGMLVEVTEAHRTALSSVA